MSLWVQRTSTGGGTLVHYSTQTDGQGWCTVPLGFSSAGNIIATAWNPNNQVTGPVLSVNTWTHIATTYSRTHGLTLYVNGVSVGSTGIQNNDAPGKPVILTLGNSLSGGGCNSQSIATGTYHGYLDEFRVYSRKLSATEVSALSKGYACFDGLMNGDETDIDCGGSCLTCAVVSSSGTSPWNTTGITLLSSSTRFSCTRMFVDSNDTLYGVDKLKRYVWKLSKNAENAEVVAGIYESTGSDSIKLNSPQDVYIDQYGNMYVLDTNNHRVQKFINGTTHGETIAGLTESCGCSLKQLCFPRGFAFDPTDTFMYVADRSCERVIRFLTNSTSGTDGVIIAGRHIADNTNNALNGPYSIRYLSSINNDLLIVNWDGHSVIRWAIGATSGTFVAGLPGISCSSSICLSKPTDVRIDADQNMYVADELNHRVQMFCKNSDVGFTVVGNGVAGNSPTQLRNPQGIAFDSAMNITIPTFRPIMFQHVTRPDFLNRPISHSPSSSGLILGLEIVSGIFFVCCIYIPLMYLIIRACWRCCLRVSNISPCNERIVGRQQMTEQSTLNVSTPYDNEQSVSAISSIFEALPPPYHIAIDKHRPEVSPPSYDIALTHLLSVHQLQSFPTTIAIEDIILQV
ncbi:unnamed protein product [Adineta steineri]|uniref:LamG-like jellyroll fold domain-containing protein n=1 Tax=Adineta steineri TaxID=433720 RepID=A0A813ZGP8_9BILA|nr:unnamed protein product [Adineta steineri]CAF1428479.1 unnamed protein product [Adineta steineri]